MHLSTRRLFQLAFGLIAATVAAFCTPPGNPCSIATPEPSYFWVIGAGSGAILLLRWIRAKK
jgi:hypothetical protein